MSVHNPTQIQVHPTAIITGEVEMGEGVEIGPYCVVTGPVKLGGFVVLHPGVIIGEPAEAYDPVHLESDNPIEVGKETVLRENVVVQRGLKDGAGTRIGPNCYIMHGTHVAHDVQLEEYVTCAPRVVLGGHTTVMCYAYLGIGAMTHQWVVVGSCAMLGMGAVVTKHIQPGYTVVGVPAKFTCLNTLGLERAGVQKPHYDDLSEKNEFIRWKKRETERWREHRGREPERLDR